MAPRCTRLGAVAMGLCVSLLSHTNGCFSSLRLRGLPLGQERCASQLKQDLTKSVSVRELLACCILAAQKAGAVIRAEHARHEGVKAYVKSEEVKGKQKLSGAELDDIGASQVVTQVDFRAQHIIMNVLKSCYPQAVVVAEENEDEVRDEAEGIEISEISAFSPEEIDVDMDVPKDLAQCSWDDLTVWVDPLDGTKEFARGRLECVSVLIGISVSQVPVAGVIHQPFRSDGKSDSCTTWGIVGAGVRSTRLGVVTPAPPSDKYIAILSQSKKDSESVLKALKRLPENIEIQRAGACGNKIMQVIEQNVDFMLHAPGSSRWDSAACEAILRALGGGIGTLQGDTYQYVRKGSHRNDGGLLACRSQSCLEIAKTMMWGTLLHDVATVLPFTTARDGFQTMFSCLILWFSLCVPYNVAVQRELDSWRNSALQLRALEQYVQCRFMWSCVFNLPQIQLRKQFCFASLLQNAKYFENLCYYVADYPSTAAMSSALSMIKQQRSVTRDTRSLPLTIGRHKFLSCLGWRKQFWICSEGKIQHCWKNCPW